MKARDRDRRRERLRQGVRRARVGGDGDRAPAARLAFLLHAEATAPPPVSATEPVARAHRSPARSEPEPPWARPPRVRYRGDHDEPALSAGAPIRLPVAEAARLVVLLVAERLWRRGRRLWRGMVRLGA